MKTMKDDERITLPRDTVVFEIDDTTYYDEERILAQLLLDGVCHLNTGSFYEDRTVCAFVTCNDIFAWACADSECVTYSELPALYEMHMADPKWGVIKWCILRRKEMPQSPVLREMKEDGAWDIDNEQIGPNTTDAETQAVFASLRAQQRERD